MANCSNRSKLSDIWCICCLPREDKAGTSLVDVKSRKDPLIHIACSCVGSIAQIVQSSPIFGALEGLGFMK